MLHGAYDLVLGFFVLHHVGDLERTFRSIATLLHPGGRVVFLEPNPFNPLYYLQILFTPGMTWRGDGGIVRMRRKLVVQAMERAGLTRCALTRFGFFPPFLSNQPWGLRLEALLERVPVWRPALPFQLFRGERA
jgi:SAM-dependent methyltransferase